MENNKLNTIAGAALAVGGLMAAATPAFAALTLDSASIVADVATVVGFITAVGVAVLGMVYVAKGFRWAHKAG